MEHGFLGEINSPNSSKALRQNGFHNPRILGPYFIPGLPGSTGIFIFLPVFEFELIRYARSCSLITNEHCITRSFDYETTKCCFSLYLKTWVLPPILAKYPNPGHEGIKWWETWGGRHHGNGTEAMSTTVSQGACTQMHSGTSREPTWAQQIRPRTNRWGKAANSSTQAPPVPCQKCEASEPHLWLFGREQKPTFT